MHQGNLLQGDADSESHVHVRGVWGFTLERRLSRHSDATSHIPCPWQTSLIEYNTLSHQGQTQVSSPHRAPAMTNGPGLVTKLS